MANYLKMTETSAILTLKEHGWSQRRIARELGIHPDMVGGYVHSSGRDSKPAKAPGGPEGSKQVKAPTGSGDVNACNATSSRSQCDPFRKVVEDKLKDRAGNDNAKEDKDNNDSACKKSKPD